MDLTVAYIFTDLTVHRLLNLTVHRLLNLTVHRLLNLTVHRLIDLTVIPSFNFNFLGFFRWFLSRESTAQSDPPHSDQCQIRLLRLQRFRSWSNRYLGEIWWSRKIRLQLRLFGYSCWYSNNRDSLVAATTENGTWGTIQLCAAPCIGLTSGAVWWIASFRYRPIYQVLGLRALLLHSAKNWAKRLWLNSLLTGIDFSQFSRKNGKEC